MAEFLTNPRTNVIYEVIAEHGEYVWVRRTIDGSLDTWFRAALEPYTPVPTVGEVWVDTVTDGDVVVVGERNGFPVVIEVVGDATPDVPAVAYRYDPAHLTPKPFRPREAEPTPEPAPEPAPEPTPEPEPKPVVQPERGV